MLPVIPLPLPEPRAFRTLAFRSLPLRQTITRHRQPTRSS